MNARFIGQQAKQRTALAVTVLITVIIALTLVACGGDDKKQSGGPPGMNGEMRAQFEKFRSCLKEHGVDLPDPGQEPQGGDAQGQPGQGRPPQGQPPGINDEDQKAFAACRKLMPTRPEGAPGGNGGPPAGGPPTGPGPGDSMTTPST